MNNHVRKIKETIEPLRQEIINHKVYSAVNDLSDLRIFMEHHIYAVWDFMSLLKSLQNNLTCTSVPWHPKGNADTRYLINEIVVGEEADVDLNGVRKSHFELYLDAMRQCGADTARIQHFLKVLLETGDRHRAYVESGTPEAAQGFVDYTFNIVDSNKDHLQAAIFTFGREDLIPGMFVTMVNDIHEDLPDSVSIFKYYLKRHIEVDGDHHSHLALEMVSKLCGDDELKWKQAELATISALEKRIELWNGAYEAILNAKLLGSLQPKSEQLSILCVG